VGTSGEDVLNDQQKARAGWNRWISARASRGIRRAAVVLAVLGVLVVLLPWGARGLGQWLVVADPLEPARAIVVLSGRIPFRAMEAASIYRAGWAPEVWLTAEARTPEEVALDGLGIQVLRGDAYNRKVLERLAVPARAIRVLRGDVWNTVDEVRLVARELGTGGADRVILVTSKTHSRRVRATWSAVSGSSSRAIVRYAREEPFDTEQWWRHTRTALQVSWEVFGLMNVWAGFPLEPDRQRR
jgi:uncharacterized SAM-binding protein YcdF (DUF218 family)